MKITKKQLKVIIESYLLNEALHDNVASEVGLTDPEKIEQIRIASEKPHKLQKPELLWIAKYFITPEGAASEEPIEDIVASIKSLKQNEAGLKRRGAPSTLQSYTSPGDINIAVSLSRGFLEESQLVSEADILYEDDTWTLYLPHTREASCTIGQGTSWCTAIPGAGNNLFYNYVLSGDAILYYLKKKNAQDENKSLTHFSLGTMQGKVNFPVREGAGGGGIVVDGRNAGLTKSRFLSIVGNDLGNNIIRIVEENAKSLGGHHPAKKKALEMMKNPLLYNVEMRGKSKDVVYDLTSTMLDVFKSTYLKDDTQEEDKKLIIDIFTNPANQLNQFIAEETLVSEKDIKKLDDAIASNNKVVLQRYAMVYQNSKYIEEKEIYFRDLAGLPSDSSDLRFCKGSNVLEKAVPVTIYLQAEEIASELAKEMESIVSDGNTGTYGEVFEDSDFQQYLVYFFEERSDLYRHWNGNFSRDFKVMLSVYIANILFESGFALLYSPDDGGTKGGDRVEDVYDYMSGEPAMWFPEDSERVPVYGQTFTAGSIIDYIESNRYIKKGFVEWCYENGFTFALDHRLI